MTNCAGDFASQAPKRSQALNQNPRRQGGVGTTDDAARGTAKNTHAQGGKRQFRRKSGG